MTLAMKHIHNMPPHLSYVSTLPDSTRLSASFQNCKYSRVAWCHCRRAAYVAQRWGATVDWWLPPRGPEPASQCPAAGRSGSWCRRTASASRRLACLCTSRAGFSVRPPVRDVTSTHYSNQQVIRLPAATIRGSYWICIGGPVGGHNFSWGHGTILSRWTAPNLIAITHYKHKN